MSYLPWHRQAEGSEEEQEEMMEYKNSEMSALIDEYIHNERNRAILKRRLLDGICYEPLAEEFDMSVRQVKTIVYRETGILFRHI